MLNDPICLSETHALFLQSDKEIAPIIWPDDHTGAMAKVPKQDREM